MKIAKKRVWIKRDGSGLVDDGDPDAGYLFASEGEEVADAEVEKFEGGEAWFADVKQVRAPVPNVHYVRPDITVPGETNAGAEDVDAHGHDYREGPVKTIGESDDEEEEIEEEVEEDDEATGTKVKKKIKKKVQKRK